MRTKLRCHLPARELQSAVFRIRRNKFDRSFYKPFTVMPL